MGDYDTWLTNEPQRVVHHDRDYPTGYVCTCGCDEWTWEPDALAWVCEGCAAYLDQDRYSLLTDNEARDEARLYRADL
jgi:hypothetical protein